MLVSLKEIGKYIDISDISSEEIATKLTNAGLEVEGIKKLSDATNLVIGEVVSCLPHPDSDHLHVCKVDIKTEILDIVCGAPNCRKGLKVIVAKVGAKLPAIEIKKGLIRGQESNGMLCALNELGVDPKYLREEQIKGIEELPSDATVGNTKVLEYLGLDDTILDLNILANRSDCYSLFNVAREIGALLHKDVNIPEVDDISNYKEKDFKVSSTSEACKQFSVRICQGIEITESPAWLKNILRSEGIRSINNIVDLGNYIMLLTGQPIHMYDLDKLSAKELIVRDDIKTEFKALNEVTYKLDKGDLVVTSDAKVMCIAGVMGGLNSEVSEKSKNIVIEVANFNHASIRKTSIRLGLSSDSSQRFIKGINKDQADYVLNLTVNYLKKISKVTKISNIIEYDKYTHDTKSVECSLDYINNRLGTKFDYKTVKDTLTSLSFKINDIDNNHFIAFVPSYRIDIDGKADLSEEVIRYIGIDSIPSTLPYMETTVGGIHKEEAKKDAISALLRNNGYYNCLTYSLISEEDYKIYNYINKEEGYRIINPLTKDHEYVRVNMLSSLLRCAEYNFNHQNKNFKLFEISTIDTPKSLEEHLCCVLVGKKLDQDGIARSDYSYFDLKGIFDSILASFNISETRIKIARLTGNTEFHPNKGALITLDGKVLAVIGEMYPTEKAKFSLGKESVVMLEMNLSLLYATKSKNNRFEDISKFPTVSRDYAFVIDSSYSYENIRKAIKKVSSIIREVKVFDIYKGNNIKENCVSLALSITFNAFDHTLKSEEIEVCDKKIRSILSDDFKAELRA